MMHYLLSASVSVQALVERKRRMLGFLHEYQNLYGKRYMIYNAHALLHLVDSVCDKGPLWGYSLYPFESINGQLGRFVNDTRYAEVQIIEKFTVLQTLP